MIHKLKTAASNAAKKVKDAAAYIKREGENYLEGRRKVLDTPLMLQISMWF